MTEDVDPQVQRLVKILNLTSSENDHEALVAIRHANKLLLKESLTWGKLLQRDATKYEFKASYEEATDDEDEEDEDYEENVTNIFESILKSTQSKNTMSFVESVYGQYKKKGYLSPKQTQAIQDIYDRIDS